MRSLRFLALLAPSLLLPLAPLACEDSSSSGNGNFDFEAGPGFDAAQSATDSSVLPGVDASTADVVPPPPPKGVTVTVTSLGVAKANVRVLFHDATGAVISDLKTDAAGIVKGATAPSMVTVLDTLGVGMGSQTLNVTYLGVADGDNLAVISPSSAEVNGTPFAHFSVAFAAGPITTNAPNFAVYAGGDCYGQSGAVGTPATVDLYDECLGTKNAVLSYTTDTNGNLSGFGSVKDLPKPGAGSTVPVGPLTFAAPVITKVTASNLPPLVAGASHSGRLGVVANNKLFDLSTYESGALEEGGLSFPTPVAFGDAFQTTLVAGTQNPLQGLYLDRYIIRREAPPAGDIPVIDFATALPAITTITVANPSPRPDVTIASDAPLTTSDGGVVVLRWNGLPQETNGSWLFVVPPTSATTFKAPALPADAAAFVPGANTSVLSGTFGEATQLPGYQALKALPVASDSSGPDALSGNSLLPSNGTLRITRFANGPKD